MINRAMVRAFAPVLVASASILLLSACAGAPVCGGTGVGLGAPTGSVTGALAGTPTGGTSNGNGYGGASVAQAGEVDTVTGTPCD